MPFQGNPNAGAADPALLSLLFQQRANREKRAFEQQKYEMEFQRQAALDKAEEDRKNREHQITAAKGVAELQAAIQQRTKDLGESEQVANQQVQAAQAQYPVSQYGQQAFAPIEERPAGLFPLMPQDQQNVGVQSQVAGEAYAPVEAQQAALANMLANVPELQGIRETLPQMGRSAVAREDFALDETSARALKDKKATTAVEAAESDRRARRNAVIAERQAVRNYNREVSKLSNELNSIQSNIEAQAATMQTAPIGSSEYKQAKSRHAILQSALSKKLLSGLDPGHFTNAQQWMDNNVSFIQESETAIKDGEAFLVLAEKNPDFLGTTRGGLNQYIANVYEGAADVGDVTNAVPLQFISSTTEAALSRFMNDSSLTDVERDRLGREMGFNPDGTLQARADAKALSSRMAYLLTRGQNPGRFSDSQYNKNLDLVRFDRGTAAQSLRNLRTGIAELKGMSDRTKQRVSVYENLSPGAFGGLVDQGGSEVLPASNQTQYESLSGSTDAVIPEAVPTIGRSGLPLLQPDQSGRSLPGDVSASRYLELSPEEKAAYIERRLKESP